MPVAVPPVNEFRWTGTTMHLLYLDDSGSAGNPNEEYLVLGGVSVFEAQASWITRRMDELASSRDASDDTISPPTSDNLARSIRGFRPDR
ncbi:MAG: hypothetical protein OXU69_09465 [Gemmatimonadota bacterium]|nr:hypothetical protein [Gemmatimonadota bacterium]